MSHPKAREAYKMTVPRAAWCVRNEAWLSRALHLVFRNQVQFQLCLANSSTVANRGAWKLNRIRPTNASAHKNIMGEGLLPETRIDPPLNPASF